ncbi:hypothetical protein [Prosthecomicrobium sp. N25]|uniref:hypothetical protein n=1 Tax=Prosthecomicrobium sp. N25 TaxID=3129254 RepID=UPI003077FBD5
MRNLTYAVALGIGVLARAAPAHEAPSGWTYPRACCSGQDCYVIDARDVEVSPYGYRILATGEVIAFDRARSSPDGQFHRCSLGGKPTAPTTCLFVPAGA